MNKTNILDWTRPFITSFPQHANLFSIISNNPSSFPWIYNHYIQLRINQKACHTANLDFCTGDNWEMIKRCPFLDVYSQPLSKINNTYSSIIDFIIESIDLGLYVILPIDWFYINLSDAYHKWHINHDLLCFGYDAEKEILHVADFFTNLQYNHYICTYKEIRNSYENIDFSRYCIINSIYTLKLHLNQPYKFDVELFSVLLDDYLLSRNSNKHFYPVKNQDFLDEQSFSYGISIYEELVHLLTCHLSSKHKIPIRPFHVLYDHKILLEHTFSYLSQEGFYLSDDSISAFHQLVKKALVIRDKLIKYNITGKTNIINECINKLIDIKEQEIKILTHAKSNITQTPSIKIFRGEEWSLSNTYWNKVVEKDSITYTAYFIGNKITLPASLHGYLKKIYIDQVDYSIVPIPGSIECENSYHHISLSLISQNLPDSKICNNVYSTLNGINSARYIGYDKSTLGNWINKYGTKGYTIIGQNNKQPPNIAFIPRNMNTKIWSTNTNLDMVLINPYTSTKTAGCIFTSQNGSLEFLVTGNKEQKITFYIMDWYGMNRNFCIRIIDADLKHLILTCDISCENSGIYYSFFLKGHVLVEIQNLTEPIAPISGIFYD